jgi:hypothetical protein
MAASGSVEQMPWARLRQRAAEPSCILAAIPPEDMVSYLRLVAQNPFLPFPDASVIGRKICALRDVRVKATLAALEYACLLSAVIVTAEILRAPI